MTANEFNPFPLGCPEWGEWEQQQANGSDPVSALVGLRSGDWLDQQKFAPVRYAVPGLLPEGSSLLVGPPKIGKSWAVLDLLLAISSGGKAFGAIDTGEARPVLYLALEDGDRRLQDRCRKLLLGQPLPKWFFYMTRVPAGRVVEAVADWTDRMPDAAAVVLDTLGKVMPPARPGESAYQRDYRIGSGLKNLADERPGLALLTNHHDRKVESGDFVDSVSGTHGLAGSADTIIVLTRARQESDGILRITGRDVAEGEYALTFNDGMAWRIHGGSLAAAAKRAEEAQQESKLTRRSDRSAEIVAAVAAAGPGGIKASALAEKFGKDVHTYLGRLVTAKLIHKLSRGFYACVRSVSSSDSQAKGSNTSGRALTLVREPVRSGDQQKQHSDTSDTVTDPDDGGAA